MCPHPFDEDPACLYVDTVYKTVLDVDPPREETFKLADQLLVGRRRLEGIPLQDIEKRISISPQARTLQLCCVPAGGPTEVELPGHGLPRPCLRVGLERCLPSLAQGRFHSRHTKKVESFLHGAKIILGKQHAVLAATGDLNGFMRLGRLVK